MDAAWAAMRKRRMSMYAAWICVRDDICSLGGDWYFCYVFEESIEKFVPWDQHFNLKLFEI